jgi:DNA-binding LytR/AlgR family response regulator
MTRPMRVVVLEDEPPARARLEAALARVAPDLELVGSLASVEQAVAWFAAHPGPDLLLADIQLADGPSFDLFERAEVTCPVIFCTAYDEYVVEAMAAGGIDYLLKPVRDADLAAALARYRRLEAHFAGRVRALARQLASPPRRLLARRRDGFVALALDEIAYFVVDDKLVDVVTRDGRRLGVDRTLAELEAELPATDYFRVNRQYLVAAAAVTGFRPWTKGKLVVELAPPPPAQVVVSQENATRFRAWLGG